MSLSRLLGLLVAVMFVAVTIVSAQPGKQPGVKVPPQIKPGMPPGGAPKVPTLNPKGNAVPMPPAKGPAGIPSGLPGVPSIPASPPPPPAKKDEINWPKEVGGKSLEATVKDMRSHPDPAVREAAIRALPLFGPKGREAGAQQLAEAMTARESDWSVRLAAISVAPTVLLAYATERDTPLASGMATITSLLISQDLSARYEAVLAAAQCGPYLREAQPSVIEKLKSRAREQGSWQMRRTAVAALGSVGQGAQTSADPPMKNPPDTATVAALLDILRQDNCAVVRREAVSSLLLLGPVGSTQLKSWRANLDFVLNKSSEKDKGVLLWVNVLIIRNDPNGLKGNELHLDAVAKALKAQEPESRLEACQAMAVLGEDGVTKLQDLIDIIVKDPQPLVIAAAITAITQMKSKEAVILPILNNVRATHANMEVRKLAGDAADMLTGKKN